MIICISVYILAFVLTIFFLRKKSRKSKQIEHIKVKKNGVSFFSYYRQFIFISNAKYILIDDQVFLRLGNKRVAIKNVSNVEKIGDKLYFLCHGKVEILFDNSKFYKFFNVIIYSDKFDLKKLKNKAMMDMVYNPLNFVEKQNFSNYIKVVRGIFKLEFKEKKMMVKANKYFLPFKIIYKLNGKTRKVSFNFN